MSLTDNDRKKKAAHWFYEYIFQDETIYPRKPQPKVQVPALIRTARSLESSTDGRWQPREAIFLKQARLLESYEDDYEFEGEIVRYYPTYQSLTDGELRGYFSWRTKLRRGDVRKTSLSFAFLYIYELINQVGVADPMDGYRKLTAFRDSYGELDGRIYPYLERWLRDYVVYYGLDPGLLANTPQVIFDRSVTVLDNIHSQNPAKVMYAVKQLAPKWLGRSKFYAQHREDCDAVIVRVLCGISDHCAARCKQSMVEQYFGTQEEFQVRLFDSAVFCEEQRWRSCEYVLDERCVFQCRSGLWTVRKHTASVQPNGKLEDLLKTIDAVMREEYGYGHPIKPGLDTKWILKLIRQETQALLARKKAQEARKITIDFSRLDAIRADAAVTREKLTVEEEVEEEPEPEAPLPPEPENDTPLEPAEYRLLQCLLYGRELGWVQAEGHIMSVLVDAINDKLYENFQDTVLDDTPAPLEDYIDDLKEMVRP